MKLPKLGDLNNTRFLNEAFETKSNEKWIKAVLLRRNVHLGFFLAGIACIFITEFTKQTMLGFLSLFLATLSLVVMTKYDTQLRFLRTLRTRPDGRTEQDRTPCHAKIPGSGE